VIGMADATIRGRVFDWLTQQRTDYGEAIPRTTLTSVGLDNVRIPLIGPSGIWKPARVRTTDLGHDDNRRPIRRLI